MNAREAEHAYAQAARILARESGDLSKRLRESVEPLRAVQPDALPETCREAHRHILSCDIPEIHCVHDSVRLTAIAEEILRVYDELHEHRI